MQCFRQKLNYPTVIDTLKEKLITLLAISKNCLCLELFFIYNDV